MWRGRGKELVPTGKGTQLINLVSSDLRSPELTARWTQTLSEIARGKASRTKFMEGIRKYTVDLIKDVAASETKFKADNISRVKCPGCGQYLLTVKGKRGKTLVCPDRDCGHRESAEPQGSHFRCPQCHKKMAILEKQTGTFVRCSNCGFSEKMAEFKEGLNAAKNSGRANKKLIDSYSDKESLGTNLGDLLKAALNNKGN